LGLYYLSSPEKSTKGGERIRNLLILILITLTVFLSFCAQPTEKALEKTPQTPTLEKSWRERLKERGWEIQKINTPYGREDLKFSKRFILQREWKFNLRELKRMNTSITGQLITLYFSK